MANVLSDFSVMIIEIDEKSLPTYAFFIPLLFSPQKPGFHHPPFPSQIHQDRTIFSSLLSPPTIPSLPPPKNTYLPTLGTPRSHMAIRASEPTNQPTIKIKY